jgi:23S rRNA (cytosine1962-C5)-methyltransferase
MKKVYLNKGKEKPALYHHNWIYSGAISHTDKGISPGEIIAVHDFKQQFLAYGYYNAGSKIQVRLLEWDESVNIDEHWWKDKIKAAIDLRRKFIDSSTTNAMRLIFSEGDALPGLIVDQFADYLSVQFLTLGMDIRREMIINILVELVQPKGIYERSDVPARKFEELDMKTGILYGSIPDGPIEIKENGALFSVHIDEGQKSGYYVDQRENRTKVAKYVMGKKVLDCFSYTGGFSVQSMKAGAEEVWSVDSSQHAIDSLKENYRLNKLTFNEEHVIQKDVFAYLRETKSSNWDVVILDPPKFAPNRQSLAKAERAYKDLNMQAMMLMKKGDILVSFSCSASLGLEHFKQILSWAAKDAGKEIQFIEDLGQPLDHPVRAAFPESSYLKGVIGLIM